MVFEFLTFNPLSKIFLFASGIYMIFNHFILNINFGIFKKEKNLSFSRVEIDLSMVEDDVGVF